MTTSLTTANGKKNSSELKSSIFDSIELVSEDIWNNIDSEKDIFLSVDYLRALEMAPPKNMEFKYAVLCENNKPVAIAYFQILIMDSNVRGSLVNSSEHSEKISYKLHSKLNENLATRMLICGNDLLCGEHGFAAVPEIDQTKLSKGIFEAMEKIRRTEKSNGKVNILLVKDFCTSKEFDKNAFINEGYFDYSVGPNMVVPIRESWETFDDYMAQMKGKYKSRVNSALKKGKDLVRKSLTLEEIIYNKDELFKLYIQVADAAKFRMFLLNPDMLVEMKRYLKDRFVVDAYYLNNEIIAYTTRIFNGNVMEGYSHGLDYERNNEYEIYQNILIDDIKEGIKHKVNKINFGRTSIGMKSSLGAIAEDTEFFMQFKVILPNHFIKKIASLFKPSEEHCRNPFA